MFRAKVLQLFCNTNNFKLLFALVEDHRSIGVVQRMIQTVNRRLGLMRIDKNNPQSKLALVVAKILKTLQITPKGITKISQIEAHMGRKPNTLLSSLATNSSPNNLSRENAEHSCLDQKISTQPPLPAEVKHDLHS